jgi:hypothetical protein
VRVPHERHVQANQARVQAREAGLTVRAHERKQGSSRLASRRFLFPLPGGTASQSSSIVSSHGSQTSSRRLGTDTVGTEDAEEEGEAAAA